MPTSSTAGRTSAPPSSAAPIKGEHGLLGRRHDAVQGGTLRLRQFAEFAHQAHLQLRWSLLRFGAPKRLVSASVSLSSTANAGVAA